MSIVVEGYSGCGIRVVKNPAATDANPRWVLEKTSSSTSYVPRLHKQIDKQIEFSKLLSNNPRVIVPEVLYRRTVSLEQEDPSAKPVVQSVTIGMRFEHHSDCISFIGKASLPRIEAVMKVVLDIIRINVAASPLLEVPSTIFTEKLVDVRKVCSKNDVLKAELPQIEPMLNQLLDFFAASRTHTMPLGQCHGDFTFSNLLIQEHHDDRVVLIDFLDSFIESPLADLAKISQDLYYGWTLRQQSRPYDRTRLFTVFRVFRERLLTEFGTQPWFAAYYRPMLVINQLRVLQYSKNAADAEYLLHTCVHQFELWRADVAAAEQKLTTAMNIA